MKLEKQNTIKLTTNQWYRPKWASVCWKQLEVEREWKASKRKAPKLDMLMDKQTMASRACYPHMYEYVCECLAPQRAWLIGLKWRDDLYLWACAGFVMTEASIIPLGLGLTINVNVRTESRLNLADFQESI